MRWPNIHFHLYWHIEFGFPLKSTMESFGNNFISMYVLIFGLIYVILGASLSFENIKKYQNNHKIISDFS